MLADTLTTLLVLAALWGCCATWLLFGAGVESQPKGETVRELRTIPTKRKERT